MIYPSRQARATRLDIGTIHYRAVWYSLFYNQDSPWNPLKSHVCSSCFGSLNWLNPQGELPTFTTWHSTKMLIQFATAVSLLGCASQVWKQLATAWWPSVVHPCCAGIDPFDFVRAKNICNMQIPQGFKPQILKNGSTDVKPIHDESTDPSSGWVSSPSSGSTWPHSEAPMAAQWKIGVASRNLIPALPGRRVVEFLPRKQELPPRGKGDLVRCFVWPFLQEIPRVRTWFPCQTGCND